MKVLPYIETENGYTLADEHMHQLWGLIDVEKTFYDGSIQTADQFLAYMKGPLTFPLIVGNGRPMGLGWLTDIVPGRACLHFCILNAGKSVYEVGQAALDYWWSMGDVDSPLLYNLIGVTPANNEMAVKFIRRLGFTTFPEVPGLMFDAYLGDRVPGIISYLGRPHGR